MDLQGAGVDGRDVFECTICMGHPRNSVLTLCGHLFCWSCLHGWLQYRSKPCPVCKFMIKDGGIVPIHGCQRGSSSSSPVEGDDAPPRPNAPDAPAATTMEVGQSSGSSSHPEGGTPLASYFNIATPSRQRLDALRLRAQADFQAIRATHPASPVGWIAEASEEFAQGFDPLHAFRRSNGAVFVYGVLVPQGEVFPRVDDFRNSWLPYYEAQYPGLDFYDHYNDFVAAWMGHFQRAWDRVGRPAFLFSDSN